MFARKAIRPCAMARGWKRCVRLAIAAIALFSIAVPALAQEPIAKHGACPTGYYASGGYCAPASPRARPALTKVGGCPDGYYASGDYCLASSDKSKPAIIKNGGCPTGYYASGNYCVKS